MGQEKLTADITLTLVRIAQSEQGTFGVLRDGAIPFAVTLEEPWRDNQPSISCIPTGRYVCKRVQSPKFGNTFEVTNVPGRTHILLHKGNLMSDTHGCILVAEEFAGTNAAPMIAFSKRGYDELMAKLAGHDTFDLEIHDATAQRTQTA
jgi:hypothetical protein